MTDTREDIKRKISKAWAPEGEIKENPVLEYCKYIIFPALEDASDFGLSTSDFKVERPEKFGGNLEIKSYEELEKLYADKSLHPMDLKQTVIKLLDELLQPVRKHFEENAEAKKLLETVKSYQVTR
jgi:tyrosyl-tRNA synthetase